MRTPFVKNSSRRSACSINRQTPRVMANRQLPPQSPKMKARRKVEEGEEVLQLQQPRSPKTSVRREAPVSVEVGGEVPQLPREGKVIRL